MKPLISSEIEVEELIKHYPFSIAFLSGKKLQCIICGEPAWGTLGELARDKNYTSEQIEELVQQLISLAEAEKV